MMSIVWRFLKPTVRHGLQAGAGILAAKGFIDASQVEAAVGIGMSIGTAAWMWVDMKRGK